MALWAKQVCKVFRHIISLREHDPSEVILFCFVYLQQYRVTDDTALWSFKEKNFTMLLSA